MKNPVLWPLALCLLAGSAPSSADEAEVAVVKDGDLVQYREVIAAFSVASGGRVVEYDLQQDAARAKRIFALIRERKPALVLAVGPTAANLACAPQSESAVFFTMVPARSWPQKRSGRCLGIAMEPTPRAQLVALKALAPRARSAAVLCHPDNCQTWVQAADAVGREVGLELIPLPCSSPDDLADVLARLPKLAQAMWMVPERAFLKAEVCRQVSEAALRHGLPLLTFSDRLVHEGALASLAVDPAAIGHQAGELARAYLLEGRWPESAKLAPGTLRLSLNLTSARRLGWTGEAALRLLTFAAENGYLLDLAK